MTDRQPYLAPALQASLASLSQAGAGAYRFRVMSYNVLADCLAREHAAELYRSAPTFSLDWSYRGELIIRCQPAC